MASSFLKEEHKWSKNKANAWEKNQKRKEK